MERVTEAATVEVGKWYLVPCAFVDRNAFSERSFRLWIPVTGPRHEDADIIGFPPEHYHYDWRFVAMSTANRISWHEANVVDERSMSFVENASFVKEVAWKRRKCLRSMPEFPIDGAWHRSLEKAFTSHVLKPDCRTCPHRGVPLNGLPVRDGAVVCPGHGLRWDLTTGAMVPRLGAP